MSVLSLETGYDIGCVLEAFLLILKFKTLEKLESLDESINPQQINLKFTNQLNMPTGPILDALHIVRTSDRAHLHAYQEPPYDD